MSNSNTTTKGNKMSSNDYKANAQKILDEAPVGFITRTHNTPWGERRDNMTRVVYMATLRSWRRKGLIEWHISTMRGTSQWVKKQNSNEGTK